MREITIAKRTDGFGSQMQNLIYAILYAEAYGYKFVYPKIESVEHNYWSEDTWINNIEFLMNLKDYYSSLNIPEIIPNEEIYQDVENNIDSRTSLSSMKKIKELFWENKDKSIFQNREFNIAIHIRRPNSRDNRPQGTDTPDSYYLFIINHLREKYKDKNPKFHIYSQGSPEKFEKYINEDTTFHLDESLYSTFCSLVSADILLTSASSLSYTAALLSDGIIYYLPFWHKPKREWNILFDCETIEKSLKIKLSGSHATDILKLLAP